MKIRDNESKKDWKPYNDETIKADELLVPQRTRL